MDSNNHEFLAVAESYPSKIDKYLLNKTGKLLPVPEKVFELKLRPLTSIFASKKGAELPDS